MPDLPLRIRNTRMCPILELSKKVEVIKKRERGVVDLSIGSPGFVPDDHVYNSLKSYSKVDKGAYGTSRGNEELINAYLESLRKEKLDVYYEQNIVVGLGAKHLLYSLAHSLLEAGDEVIVITPYWPTYIDIIESVGAKPVAIKTCIVEGFKASPDQIEEAISTKTKMIVLNNPSNPAGVIYSECELKEIGDVLAKHDIWIVTDDVYSCFVFDNINLPHLLRVTPRLSNRIIKLDSISKSYGMPGWRVGMIAAPEEVAEVVVRLNSNSISNVPDITCLAAVSALRGSNETTLRMKENYSARRDLVIDFLNEAEYISCLSPAGSFYAFPDISQTFGLKFENTTIENDIRFAELLLRNEKVAVIPGVYFGEPKSIRIAFTSDEKNISNGLDRIENFLARLV